MNPFGGSSSPEGGSSLTFSPFSFSSSSVIGLKERLPAIASAVVNSGLATNARVSGLPSFLFAKFLLKEVTIVFFSPVLISILFHMPMQGPHAFAKIVPPKSLKFWSCPSRSMVALTCSEPGVIVNCDFDLSPLLIACFAMLVALSISS